MPLLVADCPRCGASEMTFDVTAHVFLGQEYRWRNSYEVFSVCRRCKRPTIFSVSLSLRGRDKSPDLSERVSRGPDNILGIAGSLNEICQVDGYVSLRDEASLPPPDHLPNEIKKAFEEGSACYAIKCYNAASTMFRLCLDHASKPLLPDPNDASATQPNSRQRRDLGLRLQWLFDQRILPAELRELAKCVREDGNDGAHAGSLSKEDAEDLLDFTVAFLERLVTEPKRLELAEERRKQRRQRANAPEVRT